MFYLLYDYKGCCKVEATDESSSTSSVKPHLYLDVFDWRRYLPPLVRHNIVILPKTDGICMIGDLLINMPLYVYCNIINIRWEVPGLKDALDNPDMKFCPLNKLPGELLSPLLFRRRYIPRIIESVQLMCQMGLLSFAPKSTKREMEYLTVYLHKHAMLLNTESSLPGNLMTNLPEGQSSFPRINYTFSTLEDIDKYWQRVRMFGDNTRLGQYSFEDQPGEPGEINLIECCRQKDLEEIQERNWLPGDRRGAGGFDSSLFIHRQSNWTGKTNISTQLKKKNAVPYTGKSGKTRYAPSVRQPETLEESCDLVEDKELLTKQSTNVPTKERRRINKRAKLKIKAAAKKTQDMKFGVNSFHRTRKFMKQRAKPFAKRIWSRKRTPYLDEKDKESMKLMDRVRSRFTPVENGLLLICQVASWFLSPKYSQIMCVTFKTIRDIIHEVLPEEAKDKTRNALKGKYTRLSNEEKFNATAVHFLTLAKVDEELVKKYVNHNMAKSDPEFPKLYRNLVMDLLHKFRNYKNIKFPNFPESYSEMHNTFSICRSFDLLEQPIKVTTDVERPEDAHVFVIWELLQGMLHLEDKMPPQLSYMVLNSFEDKEVMQAVELLQQARIITQLKKDSRGIRKYWRNTLPHAKKVTQRHKEALRTKAPKDLFFNTSNQLSDLYKTEFNISDKQLNQSEEKDNSLSMEQLVKIEDEEEMTERRNQQGGSIDQLPCSVNWLDDRGDERGSLFTDEDKWTEMDIPQYQAGASLSLVSLFEADRVRTTIEIPDEMVKLDTSTMRKLEKGQVPGRKRKNIFLDNYLESSKNTSNSTGQPVKKIKLTNTEKGNLMKQKKSLNDQNDDNSTSQSDPSVMDDKYVHKFRQTANVGVNYRRLKSDGTQFLNEFQVSLASGSLLTLARQAAIDDMDIRANRFAFSQNFTVEPLIMRHRLKAGTVDGLKLSTKNNSDLNQGHHSQLDTEWESIHRVEESETSHENNENSVLNNLSQNSLSTSSDSTNYFKSTFDFMESILTESFIKSDPLLDVRKHLPTQYIDKGCEIVDILNGFRFKGALESEIEAKIGESIFSLRPLLRKLQKLHAIFSVGITHRRYVSRCFCSDWLTKTEVGNINWANREVSSTDVNKNTRFFQARMWRKMTGSLNYQALTCVLHKLTSVLLCKSGLSLQSLCFKLNPDLLPVASLDLVDLLEDLNCVEISYYPKKPKMSLFGSKKATSTNGPWLSTECDNSIHLCIHAPLILGQMFEYLRVYCNESQPASFPDCVQSESTSDITGDNPDSQDADIVDLTEETLATQTPDDNMDISE